MYLQSCNLIRQLKNHIKKFYLKVNIKFSHFIFLIIIYDWITFNKLTAG